MVYLKEYGRYVSRDGLVFSATRGGKLKLMRQRIKTGKRGGYWMTSVDQKLTGRHEYPVHRLVAMAFVPNPKNYTEVDHIDRNRANCSADNLRWVDRRTNTLNTERGQRLRELGIEAKSKEYQKLYREEHSEYLREYFHEYYAANKEKKSAQGRKYYQEHKEEIRIKQKEYRKTRRLQEVNNAKNID